MLLLLSSLAAAVALFAPPAAAASSPAAQRRRRSPPAPEVYGFATAGADDPVEYDWNVLTTVAWRADPRTVAAAHAAGARVDLDGRTGAAEVVLNGSVADAAAWVLRTAGEVVRLGLDGVNFDLERPIRGGARAPEAHAYTGLVAATAAALAAATLGAARVTVDVPFLPYDNDGRDYDYLGLAAAADALFVMAYDTQALMWGRCVAAANAPLGLVRRSVDAWLALGVPPGKLILGLPWYGYTYECLDDEDDAGEEDEGVRRGGEEAAAAASAPGPAAGAKSRSRGGSSRSGGKGDDARDLCRIAPVPYAGAPCSDAGGQQLGYAKIMDRESCRICFEAPSSSSSSPSSARAPSPSHTLRRPSPPINKKTNQCSTRRRPAAAARAT